MTKLTRIAAACGVLAALTTPGAALAHGGGPGHDRPGVSDDAPAQAQEARSDRQVDRRADRAARAERKASRLRRTEFRGTVRAVDAGAQTITVTVARAQRGGRALRGKDVVFTVAGARLGVADRNADGARTLADVAAGDRIRVVARVSRSQLRAGLTTAAATRVKVRAPKAAQPAS
jgi:hypothetical protein